MFLPSVRFCQDHAVTEIEKDVPSLQISGKEDKYHLPLTLYSLLQETLCESSQSLFSNFDS